MVFSQTHLAIIYKRNFKPQANSHNIPAHSYCKLSLCYIIAFIFRDYKKQNKTGQYYGDIWRTTNFNLLLKVLLFKSIL